MNEHTKNVLTRMKSIQADILKGRLMDAAKQLIEEV